MYCNFKNIGGCTCQYPNDQGERYKKSEIGYMLLPPIAEIVSP